MVKQAFMLAVSAGIASGAPVSEPTGCHGSNCGSGGAGVGVVAGLGLGLGGNSGVGTGLGGLLGGLGLGNLLGGGGQAGSIYSSPGWNWNVAGVLQAVMGGCSNGAINPSSLQAFYYWVQHSGPSYFPPTVCNQLSSWCTGGQSSVISSSCSNTLQGLLQQITAALNPGSLVSLLNGLVSQGAGNNCATCSTLDPSALLNLQAFIGTSSFQTLNPIVSGTLSTCASGGFAQVISSNAHNACHQWIHSSQCHFQPSLIAAIDAWLNGGSFVHKRSLTLPTIGTPSSPPSSGSLPVSLPPIILTSANQAAVGNFLNTSYTLNLNPNILSLLDISSVGGLISSVEAPAATLLLGWLASPGLPISPSLVSALTSWALGTTGPGVVLLSGAASYPYATLGSTIFGYLTPLGALTGAGQSLLNGLLSSLPSLPLPPAGPPSPPSGSPPAAPLPVVPTIPLPGAPGIPGIPTIPVPGAPGVPGLPTIPILGIPTVPLPGVPAPGAPGLPSLPLPGIPAAPGTPGVPTLPSLPLPVIPGIPSLPLPVIPGIPSLPLPGVPAAPGTPGVPTLPTIPLPGVPAPGVPGVPSLPGVPAAPGLPSLPTISLPTIGLDPSILATLTTAATGGLASTLTSVQTSALVAYLTSNAASIPPTIHALLISWISSAIVNPPSVSTIFGASISGGAAYTIPTSALATVLALAGGASVTPLLASALALAGSGVPVYYLSPLATAALSSFIVNPTPVTVPASTSGFLLSWLVGFPC